MIALLFDPNAWLALATLTVLEIVLGIDNLVFISVLTSRCEPKDARRVRQIGLSLAFLFRIMMLFGLTWLMGLTAPLFSLFGIGISWRDIILIGGGAFLIAKSTHEIHREIEGHGEQAPSGTPRRSTFALIIAAVVIAMIVMYLAANPVGAFIAEHPTTKMLALAFLLLIGVALIADGFDFHIPRGYIYFAMAFAGAVELFNVAAYRKKRPRNRES